LVVCNPRKTSLLEQRNKNDRIDAGKLANLLRLDNLEPVYHGQTGVRTLRELARSYLTIVKDLSRVILAWEQKFVKNGHHALRRDPEHCAVVVRSSAQSCPVEDSVCALYKRYEPEMSDTKSYLACLRINRVACD
jgi:hypothetical protein